MAFDKLDEIAISDSDDGDSSELSIFVDMAKTFQPVQNIINNYLSKNHIKDDKQPYKVLIDLSKAIKKCTEENHLLVIGKHIWHNVVQFLLVITTNCTEDQNFKYDEKFILLKANIFADYVFFKCESIKKLIEKNKQSEINIEDESNLILQYLYTIFHQNIDFILLVLIRLKVDRTYNEVLFPIFSKICHHRVKTKYHYNILTYAIGIIAFKSWKKMAFYAKDKKLINEYLKKALPSSLPVVDKHLKKFRTVLPVITKHKENNATSFFVNDNKLLDPEVAANKLFGVYQEYLEKGILTEIGVCNLNENYRLGAIKTTRNRFVKKKIKRKNDSYLNADELYVSLSDCDSSNDDSLLDNDKHIINNNIKNNKCDNSFMSTNIKSSFRLNNFYNRSLNNTSLYNDYNDGDDEDDDSSLIVNDVSSNKDFINKLNTLIHRYNEKQSTIDSKKIGDSIKIGVNNNNYNDKQKETLKLNNTCNNLDKNSNKIEIIDLSSDDDIENIKQGSNNNLANKNFSIRHSLINNKKIYSQLPSTSGILSAINPSVAIATDLELVKRSTHSFKKTDKYCVTRCEATSTTSSDVNEQNNVSQIISTNNDKFNLEVDSSSRIVSQVEGREVGTVLLCPIDDNITTSSREENILEEISDNKSLINLEENKIVIINPTTDNLKDSLTENKEPIIELPDSKKNTNVPFYARQTSTPSPIEHLVEKNSREDKKIVSIQCFKENANKLGRSINLNDNNQSHMDRVNSTLEKIDEQTSVHKNSISISKNDLGSFNSELHKEEFPILNDKLHNTSNIQKCSETLNNNFSNVIDSLSDKEHTNEIQCHEPNLSKVIDNKSHSSKIYDHQKSSFDLYDELSLSDISSDEISLDILIDNDDDIDNIEVAEAIFEKEPYDRNNKYRHTEIKDIESTSSKTFSTCAKLLDKAEKSDFIISNNAPNENVIEKAHKEHNKELRIKNDVSETVYDCHENIYEITQQKDKNSIYDNLLNASKNSFTKIQDTTIIFDKVDICDNLTLTKEEYTSKTSNDNRNDVIPFYDVSNEEDITNQTLPNISKHILEEKIKYSEIESTVLIKDCNMNGEIENLDVVTEVLNKANANNKPIENIVETEQIRSTSVQIATDNKISTDLDNTDKLIKEHSDNYGNIVTKDLEDTTIKNEINLDLLPNFSCKEQCKMVTKSFDKEKCNKKCIDVIKENKQIQKGKNEKQKLNNTRNEISSKKSLIAIKCKELIEKNHKEIEKSSTKINANNICENSIIIETETIPLNINTSANNVILTEKDSNDLNDGFQKTFKNEDISIPIIEIDEEDEPSPLYEVILSKSQEIENNERIKNELKLKEKINAKNDLSEKLAVSSINGDSPFDDDDDAPLAKIIEKHKKIGKIKKSKKLRKSLSIKKHIKNNVETEIQEVMSFPQTPDDFLKNVGLERISPLKNNTLHLSDSRDLNKITDVILQNLNEMKSKKNKSNCDQNHEYFDKKGINHINSEVTIAPTKNMNTNNEYCIEDDNKFNDLKILVEAAVLNPNEIINCNGWSDKNKISINKPMKSKQNSNKKKYVRKLLHFENDLLPCRSTRHNCTIRDKEEIEKNLLVAEEITKGSKLKVCSKKYNTTEKESVKNENKSSTASLNAHETIWQQDKTRDILRNIHKMKSCLEYRDNFNNKNNKASDKNNCETSENEIINLETNVFKDHANVNQTPFSLDNRLNDLFKHNLLITKDSSSYLIKDKAIYTQKKKMNKDKLMFEKVNKCKDGTDTDNIKKINSQSIEKNRTGRKCSFSVKRSLAETVNVLKNRAAHVNLSITDEKQSSALVKCTILHTTDSSARNSIASKDIIESALSDNICNEVISEKFVLVNNVTMINNTYTSEDSNLNNENKDQEEQLTKVVIINDNAMESLQNIAENISPILIENFKTIDIKESDKDSKITVTKKSAVENFDNTNLTLGIEDIKKNNENVINHNSLEKSDAGYLLPISEKCDLIKETNIDKIEELNNMQNTRGRDNMDAKITDVQQQKKQITNIEELIPNDKENQLDIIGKTKKSTIGTDKSMEIIESKSVAHLAKIIDVLQRKEHLENIEEMIPKDKENQLDIIEKTKESTIGTDISFEIIETKSDVHLTKIIDESQQKKYLENNKELISNDKENQLEITEKTQEATINTEICIESIEPKLNVHLAKILDGAQQKEHIANIKELISNDKENHSNFIGTIKEATISTEISMEIIEPKPNVHLAKIIGVPQQKESLESMEEKIPNDKGNQLNIIEKNKEATIGTEISMEIIEQKPNVHLAKIIDELQQKEHLENNKELIQNDKEKHSNIIEKINETTLSTEKSMEKIESKPSVHLSNITDVQHQKEHLENVEEMIPNAKENQLKIEEKIKEDIISSEISMKIIGSKSNIYLVDELHLETTSKIIKNTPEQIIVSETIVDDTMSVASRNEKNNARIANENFTKESDVIEKFSTNKVNVLENKISEIKELNNELACEKEKTLKRVINSPICEYDKTQSFLLNENIANNIIIDVETLYNEEKNALIEKLIIDKILIDVEKESGRIKSTLENNGYVDNENKSHHISEIFEEEVCTEATELISEINEETSLEVYDNKKSREVTTLIEDANKITQDLKQNIECIEKENFKSKSNGASYTQENKINEPGCLSKAKDAQTEIAVENKNIRTKLFSPTLNVLNTNILMNENIVNNKDEKRNNNETKSAKMIPVMSTENMLAIAVDYENQTVNNLKPTKQTNSYNLSENQQTISEHIKPKIDERPVFDKGIHDQNQCNKNMTKDKDSSNNYDTDNKNNDSGVMFQINECETFKTFSQEIKEKKNTEETDFINQTNILKNTNITEINGNITNEFIIENNNQAKDFKEVSSKEKHNYENILVEKQDQCNEIIEQPFYELYEECVSDNTSVEKNLVFVNEGANEEIKECFIKLKRLDMNSISSHNECENLATLISNKVPTSEKSSQDPEVIKNYSIKTPLYEDITPVESDEEYGKVSNEELGSIKRKHRNISSSSESELNRVKRIKRNQTINFETDNNNSLKHLIHNDNWDYECEILKKFDILIPPLCSSQIGKFCKSLKKYPKSPPKQKTLFQMNYIKYCFMSRCLLRYSTKPGINKKALTFVLDAMERVKGKRLRNINMEKLKNKYTKLKQSDNNFKRYEVCLNLDNFIKVWENIQNYIFNKAASNKSSSTESLNQVGSQEKEINEIVKMDKVTNQTIENIVGMKKSINLVEVEALSNNNSKVSVDVEIESIIKSPANGQCPSILNNKTSENVLINSNTKSLNKSDSTISDIFCKSKQQSNKNVNLISENSSEPNISTSSNSFLLSPLNSTKDNINIEVIPTNNSEDTSNSKDFDIETINKTKSLLNDISFPNRNLNIDRFDETYSYNTNTNLPAFDIANEVIPSNETSNNEIGWEGDEDYLLDIVQPIWFNTNESNIMCSGNINDSYCQDYITKQAQCQKKLQLNCMISGRTIEDTLEALSPLIEHDILVTDQSPITRNEKTHPQINVKGVNMNEILKNPFKRSQLNSFDDLNYIQINAANTYNFLSNVINEKIELFDDKSLEEVINDTGGNSLKLNETIQELVEAQNNNHSISISPTNSISSINEFDLIEFDPLIHKSNISVTENSSKSFSGLIENSKNPLSNDQLIIANVNSQLSVPNSNHGEYIKEKDLKAISPNIAISSKISNNNNLTIEQTINKTIKAISPPATSKTTSPTDIAIKNVKVNKQFPFPARVNSKPYPLSQHTPTKSRTIKSVSNSKNVSPNLSSNKSLDIETGRLDKCMKSLNPKIKLLTNELQSITQMLTIEKTSPKQNTSNTIVKKNSLDMPVLELDSDENPPLINYAKTVEPLLSLPLKTSSISLESSLEVHNKMPVAINSLITDMNVDNNNELGDKSVPKKSDPKEIEQELSSYIILSANSKNTNDIPDLPKLESNVLVKPNKKPKIDKKNDMCIYINGDSEKYGKTDFNQHNNNINHSCSNSNNSFDDNCILNNDSNSKYITKSFLDNHNSKSSSNSNNNYSSNLISGKQNDVANLIEKQNNINNNDIINTNNKRLSDVTHIDNKIVNEKRVKNNDDLFEQVKNSEINNLPLPFTSQKTKCNLTSKDIPVLTKSFIKSSSENNNKNNVECKIIDNSNKIVDISSTKEKYNNNNSNDDKINKSSKKNNKCNNSTNDNSTNNNVNNNCKEILKNNVKNPVVSIAYTTKVPPLIKNPSKSPSPSSAISSKSVYILNKLYMNNALLNATKRKSQSNNEVIQNVYDNKNNNKNDNINKNHVLKSQTVNSISKNNQVNDNNYATVMDKDNKTIIIIDSPDKSKVKDKPKSHYEKNESKTVYNYDNNIIQSSNMRRTYSSALNKRTMQQPSKHYQQQQQHHQIAQDHQTTSAINKISLSKTVPSTLSTKSERHHYQHQQHHIYTRILDYTKLSKGNNKSDYNCGDVKRTQSSQPKQWSPQNLSTYDIIEDLQKKKSFYN